MFLAYKGSKEAVYIQESGGIGNVNVQTATREWLGERLSYKRNLDRWYVDEG